MPRKCVWRVTSDALESLPGITMIACCVFLWFFQRGRSMACSGGPKGLTGTGLRPPGEIPSLWVIFPPTPPPKYEPIVGGGLEDRGGKVGIVVPAWRHVELENRVLATPHLPSTLAGVVPDTAFQGAWFRLQLKSCRCRARAIS